MTESVPPEPPSAYDVDAGLKGVERARPDQIQAVEDERAFIEQRRLNMASDRELKERTAKWIFGALVFQILATNLIFFLSGLRAEGSLLWGGLVALMPHLSYEQWTLRVFVGATTLEIFGLARVVVVHLFPDQAHRKKGRHS